MCHMFYMIHVVFCIVNWILTESAYPILPPLLVSGVKLQACVVMASVSVCM